MSVIVDKNIDNEVLQKLDYLKIKYYKSASLDFLYNPVKTHPDMQIHFINGCCAVVAPSVFSYYEKILPKNVVLHKGLFDPGKQYPKDCAYNVAKVGKRIIGNLRYVEPLILKLYRELNFEFVDVKQGYTKCNLCVVDDNSVITEDVGLEQTLSKYSISVLKINNGEVKLQGFPYGFIGGASGFISKDKIFFTGDVHKTSYFKNIKLFLDERKIKLEYISKMKLCDFGSIILFGNEECDC